MPQLKISDNCTLDLDISTAVELGYKPNISNLVYDRRGKEILEAHNSIFQGIKGIEDLTSYRPNQPIADSNFPRIQSYNQLMRQLYPTIHILSLEEVLQNWPILPERDSTYADTSQAIIYPNPHTNKDNEFQRQKAIKIAKVKKVKVPLIVSGFNIGPSNNPYGFVLKGKPDVREAPYLQKDGKLVFNGAEIENIGDSEEEGISVWVPDKQSGLRGLCRDGSGGLDAWNDGLLDSSESGRVQFSARRAR
jgi:hypothetical protein